MNAHTIPNRNVTLAHHWMVSCRGGEAVLAELARLFPSSPLMSLVGNRSAMPPVIADREWILSPLARLPKSNQLYRALLPLHPWALSTMPIPEGTRFLLSSDASLVKLIGNRISVPHVCYCFSPPRYIWDMAGVYSSKKSGLGVIGRWVFRATLPYLRRQDHAAAQRVSDFIADSHFVAARVKQAYGRHAAVIHPPVAIDSFSPSERDDGFYLIVSQLTPYKRVDIAVQAFSASGRKLVVIGEGSESKRLRAMAGPSVSLLGWQSSAVVRDHFERCRAFIYPQIEDFGITALEAQASGKPVIAFRAGGALDTVVEGQSGLFFDEQTAESLNAAINQFEDHRRAFSPQVCRANAERFSPEIFREKISRFLTDRYSVEMADMPPTG
jgi:glycosyltransferase involved in cell wall biosynthesis